MFQKLIRKTRIWSAFTFLVWCLCVNIRQAHPDQELYDTGGPTQVVKMTPASKVDPIYTESAMRAGIQGTVVLFFKVSAMGRPEGMRVLHGLGYGLDENAIEAVSQWRYDMRQFGDGPGSVGTLAFVDFKLPAYISSQIRVFKPEDQWVFHESQDESIIPPSVLERVAPTYTKRALHEKVNGVAILYMEVNSAGEVENMHILRSLADDMDQVCIETLRQWRFKPGKKSGNPVRFGMISEVNFSSR